METNNNLETLEMRPLKTNGFFCPLHPMQIISWVVTIWVSVLFYTLISPGYDTSIRNSLNICFGISLLVILSLTLIGKCPSKILKIQNSIYVPLLYPHVWLLALATAITPTDEVVLSYRKSIINRSQFFLNQNEYIYCTFCEAYSK